MKFENTLSDASAPQFARLFTVDEANSLLPEIAKAMKEIQFHRNTMLQIAHSKDEIAGGNGNILDSPQQFKEDVEAIGNSIDRIRDLVDQINSTGAEVKDIERGLVDFPHIRDGKVVFLCWTVGEEQITYWHDLDSGFSGRKPL